MKAVLITPLVGILMLVLIPATGSLPAMAEPKGEIKIADAYFGYEVPIPYQEATSAINYLKLLYDPLVGCFPDGRLSSEHGLANKWEMSRDGLTWTFYLRKGVKFHDGVEVTAKDAKFSIEQLMRPNSKAEGASALRSLIKNIEVKDLYTLVVQTKNPSLLPPSLLSEDQGVECLIQPKEYYEKVGEDQFIKHPIGSGPYKWHSHIAGSYMKLEATDKHWRDGVPRYKYVTFLTIPEESTQIAMLRTGEVDIIRLARERVKEIQQAGFKMVIKPNDSVLYLGCNMQWASRVFSDVRFRKALNLAFNRDDIIKHLFGGLAKPYAAYPGSFIEVCGSDPTLKPYPYAPEEAKRLIKEGGYEGHEFTVANYPRAGCPEYQRMVETVCGYWEKIGLKPKILMTDWNAWRDFRGTPKLAGTIHGANSTLPAGCLPLFRVVSRYFDSTSKETLTHQPKLDEFFDRGLKSLDMDEVLLNFRNAHKYIYDQYLMVTLCGIDDVMATNERIPQWNPGSLRNNRNFNDLIKQR